MAVSHNGRCQIHPDRVGLNIVCLNCGEYLKAINRLEATRLATSVGPLIVRVDQCGICDAILGALLETPITSSGTPVELRKVATFEGAEPVGLYFCEECHRDKVRAWTPDINEWREIMAGKGTFVENFAAWEIAMLLRIPTTTRTKSS